MREGEGERRGERENANKTYASPNTANRKGSYWKVQASQQTSDRTCHLLSDNFTVEFSNGPEQES